MRRILLNNRIVLLCLLGLIFCGASVAAESQAAFTLTATKGGELKVTNNDGSFEIVEPKPIPKLVPRKHSRTGKASIPGKSAKLTEKPLPPIKDKDLKSMLKKRPNRNTHRLSAYRPPPKARKE